MPSEGVPLLPRSDVLSYAEIEEVVHAAVRWGIRKVRVTGGEPLIRRNIIELLGRLGRLPGLEQLALTTNGTRLRRYAAQLKQARVRSVNISLDSLRPEQFAEITRGGNLADVLDGLEATLAAGIETVKVNVVVMRGLNDDELLDFIRLAQERPVTVRFIELMPLVPDNPLAADAFVPASEMRQRIAQRHRLDPLPVDPLAGPAQEFAVDGGAGRIGFISGVSLPFCGQCNRVRLTSQGDFRACLADTAGVALRPLLRKPHTAEDLTNAFEQAVQMKATNGGGCYGPLPMSQIGG